MMLKAAVARRVESPTKNMNESSSRQEKDDGDNASAAESSTTNKKKKKQSGASVLLLRFAQFVLLQIPMYLLFTSWLSSLLVQHVYDVYVTPIIMSYKRDEGTLSPDVINTSNKYYENYRNEFTYYDRRCSADDITTTNSNDLLISPDMTSTQASNVMLRHGAVAFQNLLQKETAQNLRNYLANKHAHELDYNEVFWLGEEGTRLSLGLGTNDHPSIVAAMEEVGQNQVLKTALEGIVGKDPTIIEISTLTCMAGSDDQGIHSDSDYFGSSLLYAKSFLHSYSLFIALQDTPKSLGATTVCPGTHYCADEDLEQVCLDNGAFSVSTNGQTGDDGLLRQGDGFMFNQNIWHRGPANLEKDQNRIMFIMTFVGTTSKSASSNSPSTKQDLRRQGLGTYYYQRWNMWGHTFSDLKNAGTVMVQPWAGLRALGLLPTKGIPWIHQFAQQIANGDDFYADDELIDFKEKILDKYHVPSFLRSYSERWLDFIPETMQLWSKFLFKAYCTVAAIVLFTSTVVFNSSSSSRKSVVMRLLITHAAIGLVMYGLLVHINQTDLAKSVTTGKVFERPYPAGEIAIPPESSNTMLPERNDVLFSSRFDEDYLASFTRFLEFHPGNRRWKSMIDDAQRTLPKDFLLQLQQEANNKVAEAIVREVIASSEAGVPVRFLRQNEATGHWHVMSVQEAVEETTKALLLCRGGGGSGSSEKKEQVLSGGEVSNKQWRRQLFEPSCLRDLMYEEEDSMGSVGDLVWAWDEEYATFERAILADMDEDTCTYEFLYSGTVTGQCDDSRKYERLQSGDRVQAYFDGDESELYDGTIVSVHPDGYCDVYFDDDETVERVKCANMFREEEDVDSEDDEE